jgi:hypothetical protein
MWQVKTKMDKPSKDNPSGELEWNAVFLDTQEEAEAWWKTRTSFNTEGSVHTMLNPQGEVVRVK